MVVSVLRTNRVAPLKFKTPASLSSQFIGCHFWTCKCIHVYKNVGLEDNVERAPEIWAEACQAIQPCLLASWKSVYRKSVYIITAQARTGTSSSSSSPRYKVAIRSVFAEAQWSRGPAPRHTSRLWLVQSHTCTCMWMLSECPHANC